MERPKLQLPDGFADEKLPKGVFSHSQYSTYKKCPQAYYREYVLGIRSPMSQAAFKGVAVHGGIEHTLRAVMAGSPTPDVAEGRQKVSELFDAKAEQVQGWDPDEPRGRSKDLAIAAYSVWHAKALVERGIHPVGVEEPFIKRIGTVPVVGYIDLIDRVTPAGVSSVPHPGHLVIADIKTGKTAWSQDELDRDPQFTLYSLARGVRQVRVDCLAFLKAGPTYSAKEGTRDEHAHRVLVEDYEETVDLIKRGIFPRAPIDSWGCSGKWCAHWNRCRGNPDNYGGG